MTQHNDAEPSAAQKAIGDIAPALAGYTDTVLFGTSGGAPSSPPRSAASSPSRALTTMGNTDQLVFYLAYAKDNGASEEELVEVLTHLAFYAGWPKAMAALNVAKQVFT